MPDTITAIRKSTDEQSTMAITISISVKPWSVCILAPTRSHTNRTGNLLTGTNFENAVRLSDYRISVFDNYLELGGRI